MQELLNTSELWVPWVVLSRAWQNLRTQYCSQSTTSLARILDECRILSLTLYARQSSLGIGAGRKAMSFIQKATLHSVEFFFLYGATGPYRHG